MAVITLTIPDAQLPRVIAALCATDINAPATPTAANAKAVVVKFVKNAVIMYENRLAEQTLPVVDTTGLVA